MGTSDLRVVDGILTFSLAIIIFVGDADREAFTFIDDAAFALPVADRAGFGMDVE